ncbi:DBH-like monooxygenase protein 1 [Plakobranchus ocellatus]|uniref:DBH-like monooxygenase protein 1 n=1 Tax=Plakobranchus ocellatus TaxID=259542 RepID=A0AAV3YB27_9GAST|nr:DBH-like monooxygenase protein 1 [Plakobranchus ocellatus]
MESFANCSNQKFYCPRTEEAGVRHLNLTFREIEIPPRKTNYFCMTFDLPKDQDYFLIGDEPIIDNAELLHHILVYGCTHDIDNEIVTPVPCSMKTPTDHDCPQLIGLWSVGNAGTCLINDTGFLIGEFGFKRIFVQASRINFMGEEL